MMEREKGDPYKKYTKKNEGIPSRLWEVTFFGGVPHIFFDD
jgi:hypothetical protein